MRLLTLDKERSPGIDSGVKGSNSPTAISDAELRNNIQQFWAAVNWKAEYEKRQGEAEEKGRLEELRREYERNRKRKGECGG